MPVKAMTCRKFTMLRLSYFKQMIQLNAFKLVREDAYRPSGLYQIGSRVW